jgi:hypothetical protein
MPSARSGTCADGRPASGPSHLRASRSGAAISAAPYAIRSTMTPATADLPRVI